jgi:hypothetical protein
MAFSVFNNAVDLAAVKLCCKAIWYLRLLIFANGEETIF